MATPCIPPSLEFNATLLTHEATRFVPLRRGAALPGKAIEQWLRTAFPSYDDPVSAAVAALHAAIRQAQRPSAEACERHGVRLSITEGGFGSTLNAMVKPMVHALLHNKVPLSAQLGPARPSRVENLRYSMSPALPLQLYKNKTRCQSESIECFLQPLSNCSEEQRLQLPAHMLGRRFYEIAPNKALLQSASHKARLLQSQLHLAGNFNTVSLILAALVRPSAAVAARLAETKRSLGWPEFTPGARRPLLIGVHLRAGDSCTWSRERHNRTCEPLPAYLPAVHALERAYGQNRRVYVYLATDDSIAAGEARQMDYDNRNSAGSSGEAESGVDKGAGGVFWLVRSDAELRRDWFPKQKSRLAQIESLLQEQAIDGHREAMDFMIDLLLLVECDAYVGKFSSNVDRIAYALMAARRGTELRHRMARRASAGGAARAASGVAHSATSPTDSTGLPLTDASSPAVAGAPTAAAQAAPAGERGTAGPEPHLCLPPYVSLDHPWCHDFVSWLPLRKPQPPPYAGASSPGPAGGEAMVGGIWC